MPPGRLPRELFRAHLTGRRPQGILRTHWRGYVSGLAREHLGKCVWRGKSGPPCSVCCLRDTSHTYSAPFRILHKIDIAIHCNKAPVPHFTIRPTLNQVKSYLRFFTIKTPVIE
ncbi:hypothetical protein NL108_017609 [Boleophthalmus pectinirostris]|nr:hypothetical protein NL108_017609 [Boleophthalmus pectinirostris]